MQTKIGIYETIERGDRVSLQNEVVEKKNHISRSKH